MTQHSNKISRNFNFCSKSFPTLLPLASNVQDQKQSLLIFSHQRFAYHIFMYVCIYIIYVKYIHTLYIYIHINLNRHHITPNELDINKKIINNPLGLRQHGCSKKGKGTCLTLKYTLIICLAEFKSAPGFCTCRQVS
jgi:hypothetical protein